MAEAKGPSIDLMDDLKALMFFFVVLWLAWFSTGGPSRYEAAQKPFIKPPVVAEDNLWHDPYPGEQYGSIPTVSVKIRTSSSSPTYSLLGGSVAYLTKGQANSLGKSYIKMEYPVFNKVSLSVTGLLVKDLFGKSAVIGGASNLPYQGRINEEEDVSVPPGSVVYIIEGPSPIGVSFRINECIGGLAQFQDFYPPFGFDPDRSYAGYNNCVDLHKNDPDFFSNDWRIYLGNKADIWGETGDLVKIMDSSGHTLTSVFY